MMRHVTHLDVQLANTKHMWDDAVTIFIISLMHIYQHTYKPHVSFWDIHHISTFSTSCILRGYRNAQLQLELSHFSILLYIRVLTGALVNMIFISLCISVFNSINNCHLSKLTGTALPDQIVHMKVALLFISRLFPNNTFRQRSCGPELRVMAAPGHSLIIDCMQGTIVGED